MLPIYEGIPELFDYAVDLVKRKQSRDSLAIVAYHHLAEVLDDSTHALKHYLTLTLSEPYLQNSQRGTPYQKWAIVTNNDFARLDKSIKMLMPYIEEIHAETMNNPDSVRNNSKSPYTWFHTVRKEYVSCAINQNEPVLSLSSMTFNGWLDGDTWIRQIPLAAPHIVTSLSVPILDRSVLTEIQQIGLKRTCMMKTSLDQLADWLQDNYTILDITDRRKALRDLGG